MCQISKGARKKTESGFRIWTKEASAADPSRRCFYTGSYWCSASVRVPGFMAVRWLNLTRLSLHLVVAIAT